MSAEVRRVPTREEALSEAARLLRDAEMVQDRGLMELYTDMANGWLGVASVLQDGAEA